MNADAFKDCELWELIELQRLFSHRGCKYVLLVAVGRVSTTDGLAAIEAALALKKQELEPLSNESKPNTHHS